MSKSTNKGRKKGTGMLVLRGRIYTAIWKVNGKKYTRTTGCTDKIEAEKKLAEYIKPFQEKSDIAIIENLKAKVRVKEHELKHIHNDKEKPIEIRYLIDVFKSDLTTSALTETSERVYESMLKKFREEVDKTYAYDVNPIDVDKFMTNIKKSGAESTYNRYLFVLKRMFEIAKRHDYRIHINPFAHLKKIKEPKDIGRRELNVEEVNRLISCAKDESVEMYNLFIFGAYTGMRKSDICYLKWAGIDVKNNVIRYLPIKTKHTGKYAVVPIHPKVREVLDTIQRSESDYVFDTLNKLYETNSIGKMINRVFSKANIVKSYKDNNGKTKISTGFHALRVFFASQCARHGLPINQVMKMLAHSNPNMSLHYTVTPDNDLILPDFDDSKRKVILKKETFELIENARGIIDIDEFLVCLIKNGNANIGEVQKMRESDEWDKIISDVMGEQLKLIKYHILNVAWVKNSCNFFIVLFSYKNIIKN